MPTVSPEHQGATLLEYVAQTASISKKAAKRLIDARNVSVNRKCIWMAKHPLKAGDVVDYPETKATPPSAPKHAIAQSCILQDGPLFVFNKPAGLSTNGKNSFEKIVQQHYNDTKLKAIHRLDKHTTGCLIFSASSTLTQALIEQFKNRTVEKEYQVIAQGRCSFHSRTIDTPLDHQDAITHLTKLTTSDHYTYLSATIDTGRTHQIRRHLEYIGHPVAGDRIYGPKDRLHQVEQRIPRQMLHAHTIAFDNPVNEQRLKIKADLPSDMRQQLEALALNSRPDR